jgi:Flp pilus assembly protein TadG
VATPTGRSEIAGRMGQFSSDESGSEVIEYALCLGIWLFCLLAVFYGSFLLYADHYVALAAKQSARYAIVRGSSWTTGACGSVQSFGCTATSAQVVSFAQGSLPPGLNSGNLTVSVSWPGTSVAGTTCDTVNGNNSPDCAVNVSVKYLFSFPIPFASQNSIPLSASSQMNILE